MKRDMIDILVVSLLLSLPAATQMPVQAVREIFLPPDSSTHSVAVRGWPGMITAIRFPDSFNGDNVLCADCFDPETAAETKAGADRHDISERNWILERRPKERALFLRPARLPSTDNPVSGFTTNIVVTLDGGALINLQISLSRPGGKNEQRSEELDQSDAVVTLRYSGREALSGRLAEEREKLAKQFLDRVNNAKREWVVNLLSGDVRCRNVNFGAATRSQNISLRVKKVCSSTGEDRRIYWVHYRLENRGAAPVRLLEDRLESDNGEPSSFGSNVSRETTRATLAFGDSFEGTALLETASGDEVPTLLQLHTELEGQEIVLLRVGGLKA